MIAFGKFWRKVTPRSTRQERRNILKQLETNPDMAQKIEYKKLNDRPDPEHFRVPITGVITTTPNAAYIDFGDTKEWLPLSVIVYGIAERRRVVDMPEWLARKRKLI